MLAVVGAILFGAVLYWLIFLQPHATYGARALSTSRGLPKDSEADFVVIGAGPGGLAAAERLLSSDTSATVLIIERGEDPSFAAGPLSFIERYLSGRNLLSSAPALVGSHVDAKLHVHRPLHSYTDDLDRRGVDGVLDAEALQAYPRGCCVDGTAALDWGIWVPPLSRFAPHAMSAEGGGAEWVPGLRFPAQRSPLSWAFAESAAALLPGGRHLSTAASPHRRNCVFPALLRVGPLGDRLPPAPRPAGAGRLRVATACAATGLAVDSAGRAAAVRCASGGAVAEARARRGVIVCAGAVETPRLLRRAVPAAFPARAVVRDAVAVPLVLQARHGVSDDRRRASHGVCDTIAAADVPALGTAAEVLLALVPRGNCGNRTHLPGLHVDRTLTVFAEAVTVIVVLRGAAAGGFQLSDAGPVASRHPLQEEEEEERKTKEKEVGGENGKDKEPKSAEIVAGLVEGVRLCRRIAAEPPLEHLATGRVAVDPALLPCRQRAVEYARLTHTARAKWTRRQQKAAPELFAWAEGVAHTDEYLEKYVRRHAVWMGFGSGSSKCALSDAENSLRVRGTSNLFIGDCSAATGGNDELRAGSVATAIAVGYAAADELLGKLAEETGSKKE